jgi:beta-glucuronidase
MPALLALVLLLALAAPSFAAAPPERALYADGPDGRHLLDSGWTTRADPRDAGRRAHWERPGRDAGFRRTSVPHAFNARDRSRRGFASRVQWYRTRFDRPAGEATGWRLRFESVNRHATVWLNGRRLGSHEGAYLPFELSARALRERGNELVVRVDGRGSRTDLPPSSRPRGWWNYGGILREVYLRRVRALDLADLQVIPRISGQSAFFAVRGMVRNTSRATQSGGEIRWRERPAGGQPAEWRSVGADLAPVSPGRLGRLNANLQVEQPRLWSPEAPNLYEVQVELPGGQVTTAHFGIREWGVDDGGRATLNGRPLALRGASFHEETLNLGAALGPAQRDQIVEELRALGADFTRAHYPPHPALLEAFDRAGIVMWEQIPVWRMRDRNFTPRVRREALSRLREAILRDRNHASVMTWSIANETLGGGSRERAYVRDAIRLVRGLDPTRLVAADPSLRPLDDIPAHYAELDAIGVNEYVGWYGGATPELAGDLAALRARFPRQALFVTEFGAEANRSGPASEMGTYEFQTRYLADHLAIIDASPELSGALVWVLRDFWVRPAWSGGNPRPDSPFNRKGIFDERGVPKPAFETVRERFAAVGPYS